jgi:hypothetical protein
LSTNQTGLAWDDLLLFDKALPDTAPLPVHFPRDAERKTGLLIQDWASAYLRVLASIFSKIFMILLVLRM